MERTLLDNFADNISDGRKGLINIYISIFLIDLSIPTDALLAEAKSLVESFAKWRCVGSSVQRVEGLRYRLFFGQRGAEQLLQAMDDHRAEISAVFVNHERLPMVQRMKLEELWRLPVFDRYTIVLKLFQERARTKEAKLQVALAEVPYMRR